MNIFLNKTLAALSKCLSSIRDGMNVYIYIYIYVICMYVCKILPVWLVFTAEAAIILKKEIVKIFKIYKIK